MLPLFLLLMLSRVFAWNENVTLTITDINGTVYGLQPRPFRGVTIPGLSSNLANIQCSWKHSPSWFVERLHDYGFNSIRIPVSIAYLLAGDWTVLDEIVLRSNQLGMQLYVVIDKVDSAFDRGDFDAEIASYAQINSRDELYSVILTMLTRYFHEPSFIALVSWNSFNGNDATRKRSFDTQLFSVLERAFPNRFLYVTTGLMSGNLLTGYSLEDLPFAPRILYAVHKYATSQPANPAGWDATFGLIYPGEKLVVGEWGYRDPEQSRFGEEFAMYIKERGIMHNFFFSLALDTKVDGLFNADCQSVDYDKLMLLRSLM